MNSSTCKTKIKSDGRRRWYKVLGKHQKESKARKGRCVNINPGSDIAKGTDYQSNLLHRILDAITEVRCMSIDIKSGTKIEKEIIHQTEVLERIVEELETLSSTVKKIKNSPTGRYTIKIDEKTKKE